MRSCRDTNSIRLYGNANGIFLEHDTQSQTLDISHFAHFNPITNPNSHTTTTTTTTPFTFRSHSQAPSRDHGMDHGHWQTVTALPS